MVQRLSKAKYDATLLAKQVEKKHREQEAAAKRKSCCSCLVIFSSLFPLKFAS